MAMHITETGPGSHRGRVRRCSDSNMQRNFGNEPLQREACKPGATSPDLRYSAMHTGATSIEAVVVATRIYPGID